MKYASSTSIDRTGRISAILSLACAIHCALMPLAISVLPLLGMQFLASHALEVVMLSAGVGFGAYGVLRGFARHRKQRPLFFVLAGTILVTAGLFFVPEALEPLFVPAGAVLIGVAQVLNIRYARHCANCAAG